MKTHLENTDHVFFLKIPLANFYNCHHDMGQNIHSVPQVSSEGRISSPPDFGLALEAEGGHHYQYNSAPSSGLRGYPAVLISLAEKT